jgi:hypothetical protein
MGSATGALGNEYYNVRIQQIEIVQRALRSKREGCPFISVLARLAAVLVGGHGAKPLRHLKYGTP